MGDGRFASVELICGCFAEACFCGSYRRGWRRPCPGEPLAVVAIGGYGRGELNPFSDVDVMLLHRQRAKKISPYLEKIVEQLLYLLWDSGFKVGHSTRSIKEAIVQANRDMLTKTAMLEARFLAGDRRPRTGISRSISFEMRNWTRARIRRNADARPNGAT